MVSFQCESCGDVLTKKKLDPHRSRCRGATFSCIDCMVHFHGTEYRSHTSCMTEDQKYQGALYKNKNKKVKLNPEEASSSTTPRNTSKMAAAVQPHHMSHAAYMEDVPEDVNAFLVADDGSDDDAPPHAPTPPPATEGPVNVFDFLVASASTTPNASNFNLPHGPAGSARMADTTQVVSFDRDTNALAESSDFDMADAKHPHLVEYGAGPVPVGRAPFQTPAPADRDRAERRKKESAGTDKDVKKDKKRKRLTLDMDRPMSDHPAVLHSGLTGGLNRMSTKTSPAFPPSPDSAETPVTPLKKTKPSKHSKSRSPPAANGFFSSLAAKPKSKKRKQRSASPSDNKKHKERHHRHSSSSSRHHGEKGEKGDKNEKNEKSNKSDKPAQKLLEFHNDKKESDESHGQMILFKPQADLFLSCVSKGPESERGCSMHKTLRRFHRECKSMGVGKDKYEEEKELFRSLRLRKNDRGEIVIFSVDE